MSMLITQHINEWEIYSTLQKICTAYIQAEKDFAHTIKPIFESLLPKDFDISLLQLEDAMANIIANKWLWADNACHLIRIRYNDYNSNILFDHLKEQNLKLSNGMYHKNLLTKDLQWLKIEFEAFNLQDTVDVRQINMRIKLNTTTLVDNKVIEPTQWALAETLHTE